MSAEAELKKSGLILPQGAPPSGSYVPVLELGNMLYLSGVLSRTAEGDVFRGRAGEDSLERGQQAARLAVITALSVLKNHLGNLDRIERIVRVVGYVQARDEFQDHPKVLNGASDLLITLFGDKGRHARSAVGVASLPLGAFVEIELTVQTGKL
ncbi:MAG: RidA family protein [Candidatus Omnitrophica bacterium]|nr:RidA family protein [Candidatus Omnitrophota bacterium]